MHLLLVEDDRALAATLADALRREAYAVDVACDGPSADQLHFVNDYDLIILDWNIPPPTGMELLCLWRERGDGTPVLMLHGRRSVADRVSGLDSGADDFLTKPFALDEMLARVRCLLRRRERPLHADLGVADLHMHRPSREVTCAGQRLDLSPKEFAMLEYFLMRPDEVVSRSSLVEHVWDDTFDSLSNVVDVTVHRLRSKIDQDGHGRLLHTIKGVGYVLHSRRT